jgi:hypothetical protein
MNGKNKTQIRTMNGVQTIENQRYIHKERSDSCSFLGSHVSNFCQESGYQSKGVLELMSNYAGKLSYQETSVLLERFTGEHIYTGSQIQNKIVGLEPLITCHLEKVYANQQLSFNFVETEKAFLYDKKSKEICYFDDGIGVTKQKEKRGDRNYEKDTKYVQTDVILIQNMDNSYQYLSENNKIKKPLDVEKQISCHLSMKHQPFYAIIPFVAITDGARSIRCRIERLLGKNVCIILDWYHLETKIWQYMSRLGQGKAKKERHAKELLHYLWHGNTTDALIYTEQEIQVATLRVPILEELQNYILKHQDEIIDYDTRWRIAQKTIGSGRGEKANHQIIADRQKHNGTSWSEKGSNAMARLVQLKVNNQWDNFWATAA